MSSASTKFMFECSPSAKNRLLTDGMDGRYGARHLKRSLERLLVSPLSSLVASEQIGFGDFIYVDAEGDELTFELRSVGPVIEDTPGVTNESDHLELTTAGMNVPVPEGGEIWLAV